MPPVPKCIQRNRFLLETFSHLLYQDYWLKPPQKTLAYAQAFQYWAEKANLPVPSEPHHLTMSIHELRWCMRRYIVFSDHDVFEALAHGLPEVEVEETTQPNPIEPLPADDPAVLTIAPSRSEKSATLITTPATSEEELVTLVTTSIALAYELADPPTPSETTGDARSPTEVEYLTWIKVHSSCMAASVGSIPCNPGDLRQCHCNHSSSQWKIAWHHLEEEQWALRLPSSSASSGSSLEPAPREEEDLGAKPKVLPLGFQEIARFLTTGKSSKMEDDCPQTGASHELFVEPKVTTEISRTRPWVLFTCQW